MKVELAESGDAGALSELYRTVWTPFLDSFPRDLMENRMPPPEDVAKSMVSKVYFIVRDAGMIVGVARATLEHGACLLDRMVVHPEHRGKGVGRELTQAVIDFAREGGAAKVWLDTSPLLKEAVALYESMGFRECGFFRKHYWGQDIKFYELIL